MMFQLVPSDCIVAHLPAEFARIAVPAAPPASGTTFDATLTTVWACTVLTVTDLPGKLDALGSVSVHDPAASFIIKVISVGTSA
jgi:hypothetical protein